MATVQCEVAEVTVTVDDRAARITVPSYTREPVDIWHTVTDAWKQYVEASTQAGAGMSTADFAFALLCVASKEPREQ